MANYPLTRAAGMLLVAAAFLFTATAPVAAANWESDGKHFSRLLKQARSLNWDEARTAAGAMTDPVGLSVFEWFRLRDGSEEFADYNHFLASHSDWPGLLILRRSGEASISPQDDPRTIIEYFSIQPPQTGAGSLALAQAWARLGDRANAVDAIRDGWLSLEFEPEHLNAALEQFGSELNGLHAERLDNLLWEGRSKEARAMFRLVEPGLVALAQARIALRNQQDGVDALIAAIPDRLKTDPGLAFERVQWRLLNDHEDRAVELLLERSASAESLGKPERWASRRLSIAHSLMIEGKNDLAYRVASSHQITPADTGPEWLPRSRQERYGRSVTSRYTDLEWLAGYIALRKLGNARSSVEHFRRYGVEVSSPVSIAKAAFWLGLALDASGSSKLARETLTYAATIQTAFYGQLAAQITGTGPDPRILANTRRPQNNYGLEGKPVVRAGLLAHYGGDDSMAAWFLAHWAERLSGNEITALADIAQRHGAEFSAIKVAKEGVRSGYNDIEFLFPLNGIDRYDLPIPNELAISIARQETEFRDSATSPKGAIGVMQIKPSTAREVADRIGITGDIKKVLRNREANVLLGSAYLLERLEEFTGSYVLAIASYNAGPGRVGGWLELIGDPRDPEMDPIDWIEHIPYGETRNYVMRVMEAVTIYRLRAGRSNGRIDLIDHLETG